MLVAVFRVRDNESCLLLFDQTPKIMSQMFSLIHLLFNIFSVNFMS